MGKPVFLHCSLVYGLGWLNSSPHHTRLHIHLLDQSFPHDQLLQLV